MKILGSGAIAAVLAVSLYGCASQQIVHEPGKPYPVLVPVKCIKKEAVPEKKVLAIQTISPDETDWKVILSALLTTIVQLQHENEQLRTILQPCVETTTGNVVNPE